MSIDYRTASVAMLLAEAERIQCEIHDTFAALTPDVLAWQPAAQEWGVGQCFEHLTISTEVYFPVFEQLIAGTYRPTLWHAMPVLPGLFAGMLLASLKPEPNPNLRTPASFNPIHGPHNPQAVEQFLACHARFSGFLAAPALADRLDVVLTSPFFGFVTYRLIDAFRIIVAHDLHHLAQARRVLAHPGFPRAAALPQAEQLHAAN
jgi:hypothetical protein